MRPKLRINGFAIVAVCALAVFAGVLMGSENYMLDLPVYKHFKCTLCHSAGNPSPEAKELNAFGEDFKKNDFVWNAKLARMDSDKDGYPNGIELGDENGDGTPEVTIERSNPGDPLNYPNSINPRTWGIIKKLFSD